MPLDKKAELDARKGKTIIEGRCRSNQDIRLFVQIYMYGQIDVHVHGLLKHTTPQLNVGLEIVLILFTGVQIGENDSHDRLHSIIRIQGTLAPTTKLLWPTQISQKWVFLTGYMRVQVVFHAIFLCNPRGLVFMVMTEEIGMVSTVLTRKIGKIRK